MAKPEMLVSDGSSRNVDPICGRRVESLEQRLSSEYKSRTYFFCSEGCRHLFESQAERYRLSELARSGALLSTGKVRWGMA